MTDCAGPLMFRDLVHNQLTLRLVNQTFSYTSHISLNIRKRISKTRAKYIANINIPTIFESFFPIKWLTIYTMKYS